MRKKKKYLMSQMILDAEMIDGQEEEEASKDVDWLMVTWRAYRLEEELKNETEQDET